MNQASRAADRSQFVVCVELPEIGLELMALKHWTPDAIEACRNEIALVLSALESCSGHRYDVARELLSVGELKLSCEFLCDYFSDGSLTLLDDDRERLVDVCTRLGVDENYCSDLVGEHLKPFIDGSD